MLINKSKAKNYIDKSQNNAYIQSSITIFALIVFIAFAIKPTVIKALDTQNTLENYKKYNEIFSQKVENLGIAADFHTEYSNEIELLDRLIPSTPEEGNLINLIQKKGNKHHIYIQKISFSHSGNNNSGEGIKELEFSIDLEGTYENFFNFSEDIKNSQRLIKIDSLAVNVTGNDTQVVSIKLNGTTYYKPRIKSIEEVESINTER